MFGRFSRIVAIAALSGLISGLISGLFWAPAFAQTYPNKPLRIVVPYPAGGGTDIIARLIGTKLTEAWGQAVVIDNKAGASGILGNDLVAKAAPDGYTLLLGITTMVQMPHLNPKLPYDVFKDFTPIMQLALSSNLFVVPANSPANTLKEFVALAKAEPLKYSYGSFGIGTTSHLNGELLNLQTGLKLAHIPYKGGAPLMTDLLGGQVPSGFIDLASARAHLNANKFKILAITGTRRAPIVPEVQTFAELGLKDFESSGWFGLFLPANAPKEVVSKLSAEMARIMKLPDVQARINDMSLQPVDSSPEAFAAAMRNDYPIWGRIVRDANIKLD